MEQPTMADLLEQVDFAADWEARLAAIVAALIANDVFDWAEFRAHIVRLNGALTNDTGVEKLSTDLSLWAHALRNLLNERGLLQ